MKIFDAEKVEESIVDRAPCVRVLLAQARRVSSMREHETPSEGPRSWDGFAKEFHGIHARKIHGPGPCTMSPASSTTIEVIMSTKRKKSYRGEDGGNGVPENKRKVRFREKEGENPA